jgi:hypothetical protein
MLQVWLDESGRGQQPVFVLAGYLSSTDVWNKFSAEWKQLLQRAPALRRVKGTKVFRRRGGFKGSNERLRDQRALEFARLIARYSPRGIAFVIGTQEFNEIVKTAPSTPFKNPDLMAYFLSLATILPIVQSWFSSQKVEIIFDSGLVRPEQAAEAYEQLFAKAPDLAALLASRKPRFEDDEQFPPLQAADLLAYYVCAEHDPQRAQHVANSPIVTELRKLPTMLVCVNAALMQYWRDRVEKNIPRRNILDILCPRPW